MKYDSDSDDNAPTTSANMLKRKPVPASSPQLQEKKIYAIAISSINDAKLKAKYEKDCENLGCTFVKHIAGADFLLTVLNDNKIRFSAKFLASICKGIPIVSGGFIEASNAAGMWLDPHGYIVYDPEAEVRKSFSLRALIEKTSKQKFLSNFSVFITKNTTFKTEELQEIIQNAEGECLTSVRQKPSHENLALIYNEKDKTEIKAITKKYPNINRIKDINFCNKVLRQEV
jgi:hypothetical protein